MEERRERRVICPAVAGLTGRGALCAELLRPRVTLFQPLCGSIEKLRCAAIRDLGFLLVPGVMWQVPNVEFFFATLKYKFY